MSPAARGVHIADPARFLPAEFAFWGGLNPNWPKRPLCSAEPLGKPFRARLRSVDRPGRSCLEQYAA